MRWTKEENARFIQGVKRFGKDFYKIAKLVGTRSESAVYKHALIYNRQDMKNSKCIPKDY